MAGGGESHSVSTPAPSVGAPEPTPAPALPACAGDENLAIVFGLYLRAALKIQQQEQLVSDYVPGGIPPMLLAERTRYAMAILVSPYPSLLEHSFAALLTALVQHLVKHAADKALTHLEMYEEETANTSTSRRHLHLLIYMRNLQINAPAPLP